MQSKVSKRKKFNAPTVNVYKLVHLCMLLLVLVNVFIVYRFEKDRQPVREVHQIVTTSNHVHVVTNVVFNFNDDYLNVGQSSNTFQALPTNELGGVKVNATEYMIDLPYHYCKVGGRAYIQIAGITFSVGDLTSYGRIESIFPERVLLDNGYSLKNTDFDQRFGLSSSQVLSRKRDYDEMNKVENNSSVVPVFSRSRGNSLNGEVFFDSSGGRSFSDLRSNFSLTNSTRRIRR